MMFFFVQLWAMLLLKTPDIRIKRSNKELKKEHLKKLICTGPLFRILGERDLDKAVEIRSPLVLIFERRRLEPTLGHNKQGSHGV